MKVWDLQLLQAAHSLIMVTRGEKLLQEKIHLQKREWREEGCERKQR